jgi:thiamine pyrophosphokinase
LTQIEKCRAVIFANGDLWDPAYAKGLIREEDLIIAADGGGVHCLEMGLQPDIVIGDLDSLPAEALEQFERKGSEVIRYPERKDYTDLELAILLAKQRGAGEVLVMGALGQRWDQTLANLLMPAGEAFKELRIRLLDGHQAIQLMHGGECLRLTGSPGDTVSLVPLAGNARAITTQGLEYPLNGEDLIFGSTRGISNVLLGETAAISLEEGLLLVVTIHQDK